MYDEITTDEVNLYRAREMLVTLEKADKENGSNFSKKYKKKLENIYLDASFD